MRIIELSRYNLLKNHFKQLNYKSKLGYAVTSKNIKIIYSNNIIPKSTTKKFAPNFIPKLTQNINLEKKIGDKKKIGELRVNDVNIQMISRNIYEQIFKLDEQISPSEKIKDCQRDLVKHGIKKEDVNYVPDINLKLPALEGANLIEHYEIIGEEQAKPYRDLLKDLLTNLPPVPKKWLLKPGWTRYAPNCEPITVTHPLEDAMVFDVEICLKAGRIPTLATAVSNKAWYGWISQALEEERSKPMENQHYFLEDLIPLENSTKEYNLSPEFTKPRIVVGHNVSFDRSRVKEQYFFEKTGTRFIDTMSLHVCVSGITSYQRAMLKSEDAAEKEEKWKLISSLNSLSEVHKLYCGSEIDKSTRDIFLEGSLSEIKEDFDNVMDYCAKDVIATYNVLKTLLPLYLERFPHPVTLAGILELGMAYLPVNSNWNRFINDCEQTYEDLNTEAKFLLSRRAEQACQLMHNEKYKEDLWMWDQDWTEQEIKIKKTGLKLKKIVKHNQNEDLSDFKNKMVDNSDINSALKEDKEKLDQLVMKFISFCDKKNILPNSDSKYNKIVKEIELYIENNMKYLKTNKQMLLTDVKNKMDAKDMNIATKDEINQILKKFISIFEINNLLPKNKLKYEKLVEEIKENFENEILFSKTDEETSVSGLNDKMAVDSDINSDEDINKLELKFKSLFETKNVLQARKPYLPGYPLWYRKLCAKPGSEDWVPGPQLISTSMQVTPKLLSLTWEGYPLHYIRDKGWGFLVPHTNNPECKLIPLGKLIEKCPILCSKTGTANYSEEMFQKELDKNLNQKEWWRNNKRKDNTGEKYKGNGVWCNVDLENSCWFMKLPHKDGVSHNVGNPLARDFLNKFSDKILAGDNDSAEKVLTIARMLSYWRNNRDRIMQQIVVWLKQSQIPKNLRLDNYQYGVILPQVVVCGTLTRRAMEPTWMTAANAKMERVGSELRSMVQVPPGYNIVGADVDSQELWIASVLGDADYAKMHGATPLGWMTLIGSKNNGTDMHSVTAKAVGISRDHSKVINYARIYGAGQNFAERLLKQFNPTMSEQDAKSKAAKMFAMTKGKRIYQIKPEFHGDFENKPYSGYQAFQIAKIFGKTVDEIFFKPKWMGGSESAMFNRLEEIAGKPNPVTPFLEGRLSRALEPENMNIEDRFLPTRVNWVVQSGAVDFLHLMLVTMRWLMKDKVRFCLSFHDEVRYIVPDDIKYEAALALHITNLLTRTFCSMKLGINDLPMSIAFFSSVEVDTVLRKESHMDCVTPSNPHGLEKGYGIKNGESLSIEQCIEKTGGEINLWKKKKKAK